MIPATGSLVLYKSGPARVLAVGDKIEIQLAKGKTQRVRPKDITLLHPGPVSDLDALRDGYPEPTDDELEEASELLDDETVSLEDLADLVFGEFTPGSAWATWRLLIVHLYFEGTPEAIRARSPEDVARDREERTRKAVEKAAWSGFLQRVEAGAIESADRVFLSDVEELALGKRGNSRVLKAINKEQTPANAHALLLRLGVWDRFFNPYPVRAGIPVDSPELELPALPDEERRDLTHLTTYAIDDEGNQDPDDALSLDGGRLWVHVADVAALVMPESLMDLEARSRSGTLYLPELTATMLPDEVTRKLGLGLQEVSPALSFGLDLNADGGIDGVEVVASWIKAERLSYQVVDRRLDEAPFAAMLDVTERFRARRHAQGAISLDFPEVDVKVHDGRVIIQPQPRLRSRRLVSEAMLMAGEGLAHYADEHGIPFPYATQAVAEDVDHKPEGLAQMMVVRRKLRPRRYQSVIGPHEGLGLMGYAQVTSPLRRYLDLVAHQQLRAHLKGEPVMDEETLVERIGATDAVAPLLRKTERFSRRHWTLVWLKGRKDWQGVGVLVEQRKRSGLVIIPDLALDVRVTLKQDIALDSVLPLLFCGIDLPGLEAHFRLPK